jgi:alanine racemase
MSIRTQVNLAVVRRHAETIREKTGVDLIPVLKADAYGLGAVAVADAINDLASGWYVFRPSEAIESRLWDMTGRSTIAAVVLPEDEPQQLLANHIRPGVWDVAGAARYAICDPVLCVDTGMQRFACPIEKINDMRRSAPISEAFTHAVKPEQAVVFRQALAGSGMRMHAAGSALLDEPDAWLDAVRPGLALYHDAVRVSARLVEARETRGPVGYGGFSCQRIGVMLLGYANGMRVGPCLVNGRRQRVMEVGMQSSYVSLDPADRRGDEVVLLGDGLLPGEVAESWGCSAQHALLTIAQMGEKAYE